MGQYFCAKAGHQAINFKYLLDNKTIIFEQIPKLKVPKSFLTKSQEPSPPYTPTPWTAKILSIVVSKIIQYLQITHELKPKPNKKRLHQ